MSNHVIDLTGQKFGRLVVISQNGKTRSGNVKWLCKCDCGNFKTVASGALRSGETVSCGCWIREKTSQRSYIHGETNTRLHHIWSSMKARCYYTKAINYPNYGGRGIKVCDEWIHSYIAFRDWAVKHGYTENSTIDREDVNGNYCSENCQWISAFDQQSNKTNNRKITVGGVTNTVTEWGRKYNIDPQAIWGRLNRGWGEEEAVTTPSGERRTE